MLLAVNRLVRLLTLSALVCVTHLHKHALHGLDFAQELNLKLSKQIVVVRDRLQGELLDAVWDTSSGKHWELLLWNG